MSWATFLLLAAAGTCIGSFASTLGLRLAAGRTWIAGASACDGCGRTLGWTRTVPLISYARVGGRCADCGHVIDPAHPIGEAAGAILALVCIVGLPAPAGPLTFALAMVLIAASMTDLKALRLPDPLTAVTAGLCLILSSISGLPALFAGGLAAVITVAGLQGLRLVIHSRKGEPAMGLGDVKLAGALALWLGTATPWAIATASAFGLIAAAFLRSRRIAFGPCLAVAGFGLGLLREWSLWPIWG